MTTKNLPEALPTANVEVILVHDSSRDSGAPATGKGNLGDDLEQIVNLSTKVLH